MTRKCLPGTWALTTSAWHIGLQAESVTDTAIKMALRPGAWAFLDSHRKRLLSEDGEQDLMSMPAETATRLDELQGGETLTCIDEKVKHEVGDYAVQHALHDGVWKLHQRLRQRIGVAAVHACSPFPASDFKCSCM